MPIIAYLGNKQHIWHIRTLWYPDMTLIWGLLCPLSGKEQDHVVEHYVNTS